LSQFAGNLKFNIEQNAAAGCFPGMDSATLYRHRAAQLRQLASAERDVSVRQQLTYHAIRFDEFADDLEARENELTPLSADEDDRGHA
jgi:hypothetical protein